MKTKYKDKELDLSFINKSNLDWLYDRTIYLTVHGSHAYGCNTPDSDIDLRGIAVPTKKYFFGYQDNFEQAQFNEVDCTIFDIRKFVKLAADFNPNAVEILFTDPEEQLIFKDPFKKLFEIKNKFISKKAKFTMSGYAISQLRRIHRHRRWLLNPMKEPPKRTDYGLPEHGSLIPHHQLLEIEAAINKKLDEWNFDTTGLDNDTSIWLKNKLFDLLKDLKINTDEYDIYAARSLGLNDNLTEAFKKERKYKSAKREWDNYQHWKKTRNPERAKLEEKYGYDVKHASHLFRLFKQCEEVLLYGVVRVKRPDAEQILAIKNGAWTYEQIIEFAEEQDKYMDELYKKSTIPREPDRKAINDVCIEIVEAML